MSLNDLSLRHLPDLSDASFSFQIPTDADDDLLRGDATDFFRGAQEASVRVEMPPVLESRLDESSPRPSPAPQPEPAKSLLPTTKVNLHAPLALRAIKPGATARAPTAPVSAENVPTVSSPDDAPKKPKSTTRAVPPSPAGKHVKTTTKTRTAPAPHPAHAPAAPDADADTGSAARLMAYAQQWQTLMPHDAEESVADETPPPPVAPAATDAPHVSVPAPPAYAAQTRARAGPAAPVSASASALPVPHVTSSAPVTKKPRAVPVPPVPSVSAPAPVSVSVSAPASESSASAPRKPVPNPVPKVDDSLTFGETLHSLEGHLPPASPPPCTDVDTDANTAAPPFVPPPRAGTHLPRIASGAGKRGRTRAVPVPAPVPSGAVAESASASISAATMTTASGVLTSVSATVSAPMALNTKVRSKTPESLKVEWQKQKTKTAGEKKRNVIGDGDTKKDQDDSAPYTREARVEPNEPVADADVDIAMQAPVDVAEAQTEMRIDDASVTERPPKYEPEDEDEGAMALDGHVPPASPPRDDSPLTLSQLSPRKRAALGDGARDGAMPAPVRMDAPTATAGKNLRGTKRRMEAPGGNGKGEEDGARRKRSRGGGERPAKGDEKVEAGSDVAARGSGQARGRGRVVSAPVSARPRARVPSAAASASVAKANAGKVQLQGSVHRPAKSTAASSSASGSGSLSMRAPWDSGSMHDGSGADKREGHEMKSTSARAPSASLMQSTRSVASTSTSTSTSTNKPYKIPDFAALHAVQAAHFAALRASTAAARAPTVSVAPHLSTDVRAAERAKFEGALREREAERERERERERGEREEKEREEEKEARRKAVVKAHGVPEWYRDAPKRAGGGAE